MAKPLPTHSFLCPNCTTQLRVRERRFINREITCPACETIFLISLTDDEEIKISLEDPKPISKIAKPQPTASLLNLNAFCWAVSFILICLIGYVYLGKPAENSEPTIASSNPNEQQETEQPTVTQTEEPANIPPADPLLKPPSEQKSAPEPVAPQVVEVPAKKWEPRNLHPTLAEKPEPKRPPIPEKWVALMELSIEEYRVEELSRLKMLEELEVLAGSNFEHADEATTSQISSEPNTVSFVLKKTNFAELLEKTLEPVGLTYKLLEDKILILQIGKTSSNTEVNTIEKTLQ